MTTWDHASSGDQDAPCARRRVPGRIANVGSRPRPQADIGFLPGAPIRGFSFTRYPKPLSIDLVCAGLWQFVEILDRARILEWHKCSLDEILQRFCHSRVRGV